MLAALWNNFKIYNWKKILKFACAIYDKNTIINTKSTTILKNLSCGQVQRKTEEKWKENIIKKCEKHINTAIL